MGKLYDFCCSMEMQDQLQAFHGIENNFMTHLNPKISSKFVFADKKL